MKKILYKVTTTFLGASSPSNFYFDQKEKAKKFLQKECINGEIKKIEIKTKPIKHMDDPSPIEWEINYSDGCTKNDLCYGDFEHIEEREINNED